MRQLIRREQRKLGLVDLPAPADNSADQDCRSTVPAAGAQKSRPIRNAVSTSACSLLPAPASCLAVARHTAYPPPICATSPGTSPLVMVTSPIDTGQPAVCAHHPRARSPAHGWNTAPHGRSRESGMGAAQTTGRRRWNAGTLSSALAAPLHMTLRSRRSRQEPGSSSKVCLLVTYNGQLCSRTLQMSASHG